VNPGFVCFPVVIADSSDSCTEIDYLPFRGGKMSLASMIELIPWAMNEAGLRFLITVADRGMEPHALEKSLGKRPGYAHSSTVRDGVGIVPIQGAMFKRANLITEVCAVTSYEMAFRDLATLLDDASVKSIVLNIDSPGGEANGCSDLAEFVFSSRSKKPIIAYISGQGCSAAYWIASACTRIVASETAMIGSIGVQSVIRSKSDPSELRFVSSQSPLKNADPATETGAREVQRIVDNLGEIFVGKVARNRGTAIETVLKSFGQGATFLSEEARMRGMIDRIATFEGLMSELTEDAGSEPASKINASALEQVRVQERKRIVTIQSLCRGRVSQQFCESLIDEGLSVEEAAFKVLTEADRDAKAGVTRLVEADRLLDKVTSKKQDVPADDEADADIELAIKLGLVA
jgi:ClpP class serine protease